MRPYFKEIAVSSAAYSISAPDASWDFSPEGLRLTLRTTTQNVYFSSNGINDIGELIPNTTKAVQEFPNHNSNKIYLRLKTAGTTETVQVEVW